LFSIFSLQSTKVPTDIDKPKDKSLSKSSSSTDIDKSKDKSLLKNSNSTTIVEKLKTNLCQGIISDKCEDGFTLMSEIENP